MTSDVQTWEGVVDVLGMPGPVYLHLADDGDPSATYDVPAIGAMAMPVEDLEVTVDALRGRLLRSPFVLQRTADGYAGSIDTPDGQRALDLRLEHPDVRHYTVPLQAPVTYCPPESLDDGWPLAKAVDVGLDLDRVAALSRAIAAGELPRVDDVVMARNGKLVVDDYYYGRTPATLHTFQSCTKSITALVVGCLVDRGLIGSLDEQVWPLFIDRSELRWVAQRYDVTVRQLLTMSAHLVWNEEVHYTDPSNDNTRMNASGDLIGYVLSRALQDHRDPKLFEYQSGLTILLGEVIRRVVGRAVDDVAAEMLFGPLGITDFRWLSNPDGTKHTGGGLCLRPRDMAKIGQMMLDGGRWQGHQVLSAEWIAQATSVQTAAPGVNCGFSWFLGEVEADDRKLRYFNASGYGGQYLFGFPDLQLVVVVNAHDFYGDGSIGPILKNFVLPAVS